MKIPKITRKNIIIALLVVGVIGIWFYQKQKNKPTYDEYTVEQTNIKNTLELSGKVSSQGIATLRFGAGGYVTYLGAQEGDTVKKWQTLASLDSRQLNKVLEQKLNLYAIQRNTFDQTIDDNDNSVPDGDLGRTLKRLLEKNQYQLENTVKDVEYQNLSIQLSRIYSPINGVLVHSPITVPNVQVAATDTWIVVDPSSLEFIADLDETDISKVEVGQKVELELDAYPDEIMTSEISSISYAPKETTAGTTYEIKIKIPESFMSRLRLGLNGTATVIREEKAGIPSLPISAITFQGGDSKVTVLNNGKYETKNIETGIENDGLVEIVSGLGVGDHVYTQTQ